MVDVGALTIVAFSGMLAFFRGFVREVLGIAAWVGAAIFAMSTFFFVQARFCQFIENPDIADPVAFACLFIVALIVFSILASTISGFARVSMLGGVDKTLGMLFGFARGAALIAFAYIALGLLSVPEKWPDLVLQARLLPLAYAGANWGVARLPAEYRPRVYPPPGGREATAADLLRVEPRGRAFGQRP